MMVIVKVLVRNGHVDGDRLLSKLKSKEFKGFLIFSPSLTKHIGEIRWFWFLSFSIPLLSLLIWCTEKGILWRVGKKKKTIFWWLVGQ